MQAAPRSAPPRPPARGSFPLDHDGECKALATAFLKCLRDAHANHAACRDVSKLYLECRMDKGLMARENLDSMGFARDIVVVAGEDKVEDKKEIVAGLNSAKKAKGALFGIALPGSGYEPPKPVGGMGGHSGGGR